MILNKLKNRIIEDMKWYIKYWTKFADNEWKPEEKHD